eukprot:jgi/Picsp_1/1048/NSC_04532-R1_cytochrome c6
MIQSSCIMIQISCTSRRPTVARSQSKRFVRPSLTAAVSKHSEKCSNLDTCCKSTSQNNYKVNVPAAIVAACLVSISPAPVPAQELLSEQTFSATCAGCHAGGGNIVKREATLKLSDLSKYGFGSPEALFDIIYFGKGSMPGYGEKCQPRGQCTFGKRLDDDEIRNLATYVIENAKKEWKD